MSSVFIAHILEANSHQTFHRIIGVFDSFDSAVEGSIQSIETLIDLDIKSDSADISFRPVNDYASISNELKLKKCATFAMPGYDCEVEIGEFVINQPIMEE